MELYGQNPVPGSEWGPVDESATVLEESMMRMGLGNTDPFPERAGVSDCDYYMRTGFCGFGSRCRYNHPRDRTAASAAIISGGGEYPERTGEPVCQFYLKTGTCKFGPSCKFHHPKQRGGFSQVQLNIYGLPLRPEEKECSYYLKTGQCKFGVTCKFHHPQAASAPTFFPTVQSPNVPTPEQYSMGRPPLIPGSYVQGAYGPVMVSPGVVPHQGWHPYSAPISPSLSPGPRHAMVTGSVYGGVTSVSSSAPIPIPYTQVPSMAGPSGSNQKESIFPERPGQPECQYYLKTGDCKFGASCRYHHRRDWVVPQPNSVLSPLGFPLRPGVQPCAFYLQNGQCKFGASCKYDHPLTMRYGPSVSSLTNIPIAPYSVGSPLAATQAPSYSSSELRSEFMSGSPMDSHSIRIPSAGNGSSSSVGVLLSQTGLIPLSDVPMSGQNTSPADFSRRRPRSG